MIKSDKNLGKTDIDEVMATDYSKDFLILVDPVVRIYSVAFLRHNLDKIIIYGRTKFKYYRVHILGFKIEVFMHFVFILNHTTDSVTKNVIFRINFQLLIPKTIISFLCFHQLNINSAA